MASRPTPCNKATLTLCHGISQKFHNEKVHHYPMRRVVTALGIGLALIASPLPSAFGDDPIVKNNSDDKSDYERYRSDLFEYNQKRKEINDQFFATMEKINQDPMMAPPPKGEARTAMVPTQRQKRKTMVDRRAAIAVAIQIRDEALAELGPIPTPPSVPKKANKPVKKSEKSKKN